MKLASWSSVVQRDVILKLQNEYNRQLSPEASPKLYSIRGLSITTAVPLWSNGCVPSLALIEPPTLYTPVVYSPDAWRANVAIRPLATSTHDSLRPRARGQIKSFGGGRTAPGTSARDIGTPGEGGRCAVPEQPRRSWARHAPRAAHSRRIGAIRGLFARRRSGDPGPRLNIQREVCSRFEALRDTVPDIGLGRPISLKIRSSR